MKLIEAKNISVTLGKREILKDVHIDLEAGEIVGLIGPNGAGKSTLIRALAGVSMPSSGEITILGQDQKKMKEKDRAKTVAYMPQNEWIYWPLPVERVIALGRIPHLMPWQQISQKDEQIVTETMKLTDVKHLVGRSADQLATGEKRLVMLSRVLAVDSPILLADEPVAALDPNHELQVMQLLKTIAEKGRGVMVVLHHLTLAARFCNRLFLMHHGRMVASGSPREVLTPEKIKNTYGVEVKYGNESDGFYVIPWKRV